MSTLVVCLHRGESLPGATPPVVGREPVESLVTTVGVDDPENSRVNCLLEGLKVAGEIEESVVAVVSGGGETVSADREVARQVESLVGEFDPDSAIVVVDSAEDEQLVPIVESRLTVDAVDRVVVRQARDIESTYYLLKQFLADEQLRKTVLVPLGAGLLAFPLLLFLSNNPAVAIGAIAAAIGVYLLYRGLGIDAYLARLPGAVQTALYAGQVSLVTYVVAAGLALVGLFVGALDISGMESGQTGSIVVGMWFAYGAVPWLTVAALAASAGRLLDEFIRRGGLGSAYVNLPFVAVAVGLAVRGFAVYFLQRSGVFADTTVPGAQLGPVTFDGVVLAPSTSLALFVLSSILISLVGVRVAAYVGGNDVDVGVGEQRS